MDILVGILVIVVGLSLCFAGRWALRLVLAMWGALAGFGLGVTVVEAITSDGILQTTLSWTVGLILAVLFSAISYLYFSVAVFLAMASIGYVIGVAIASAFGASASWLLALAGLAVGVLLAFIAIAANLPMVILIVVSSLAGASLAVSGLLLAIGVYSLETLEEAPELVNERPWWTIVVVVLAIAGAIIQSRSAARDAANMRELWGVQGTAPVADGRV